MSRIGYARVSSYGQSLDVQLERLADCDRVFKEKESGRTDKREQLQLCLDYVVALAKFTSGCRRVYSFIGRLG